MNVYPEKVKSFTAEQEKMARYSKALEKLTREVVEQNGIEATVTKVEDIVAIMNYGVMSTPALVIDEKVVLKGRLPSPLKMNRETP